MKITADTNVLVRAVVQDDPAQTQQAVAVLLEASLIAVTTPSLCELVWVLRKVYGFQVSDVAQAIRALIATANVEMNRPAVAAGLAMLEAGGDFADGAIAYEGSWLGGETLCHLIKRRLLC
jgi:predicted nucleic-acid-binding protein